MGPELVKPHNLGRRAVIYVRQSTPHQVLINQESVRLQYALRQRARALGWHKADIDVIDADLGLSGAAAAHRQGFKDLVARVTLGEVGLILSTEVTRLARNCSDWYPRPATLMAVVGMLRNPAYAGTFVYGRSRLEPSATPGAKPVQLLRPSEGWRFVVRDKYPAYIDIATFEKIQAMLDGNRADYMRTKGRGIPRDGAALLHGIVWCGECGYKMAVRYKGGSQYVCNHLHQQHAAPVCQCLRAAAIDAQVAAAFLEAVAPAEIEAWSRARKAQRQADEAFQRAEAQQVERLRYQAALAERQFNRVDPDNRLIAAELERRWEVALSELRRAEAVLARRGAAVTSAGPDTIDPQLRAKVVSLGQRLRGSEPTPRSAARTGRRRCAA